MQTRPGPGKTGQSAAKPRSGGLAAEAAIWEGRRRAAVGRGAEMGDAVRPEGEGQSIIHFFSLVWLFQCLFHVWSFYGLAVPSRYQTVPPPSILTFYFR